MSGIRRENAGQRRARLGIPPGACTWCAKAIESKRPRSWCGPECVAAFKAVNHTAEIRKGAWARCHGRCQGCGRDLVRLEGFLARWRERSRRGPAYPSEPGSWRYGSPEWARSCEMYAARIERCRERRERHAGWVREVLRSMGFRVPAWRVHGPRASWTTWEADHVTPVEHGALPDDPRNIVVMCKPCHAAKTARQARERGARRKGVSGGNG